MITVQLFLNGQYWRNAEVPGIKKHFQVRCNEPDGKQTQVDCYVEPIPDGTGDVTGEYQSLIIDPTLEPDSDNPYALRRKED